MQKNKFIEYHNHSDFTLEHDVSRRKSPEGRTTKSSVNHEDSFALKGPKILLSYDFQYPIIIITTTCATTASRHEVLTHSWEREQVRSSLFTHTNTHTSYTYTPGLFTAKERTLPLTRKIGRIHKRPSSRFKHTPFSLPAQIFSVFLLPLLLSHIPWVLLGRLGGKGARGPPAFVSHFIPIFF